jgi:hypothetical protein
MVLRRPSARSREGLNDGHRRTSAGEQFVMSDRERLPDRRVSELVDFEHGGRKWTATFGRFADGRIAEVFLDAPKESPLVELAQDGALAASLALQSGCPLETLRHALSGREAGPLRIALALIDAYQAQHKDSQQTGADR